MKERTKKRFQLIDKIINHKKSFKDDIRNFESRNKDTENSIKENLDIFKDQLNQAKDELNGQFKEEVKGLTEMTENGMKELKGRVDTLVNGDIANSTRKSTYSIQYFIFYHY